MALLRLAAKRRLTDAVAALLLCANADDPRELELASLVWTAFLAGCDRREEPALGAGPEWD